MYFSEEGQKKIQRKIENIKRVGAEVLKSKEASRQFLIDIGVIKEKEKRKTPPKKR